MNKNEALNQLNKALKERKDKIKRGENVKESREAVELIERKIKAIKRLG